MRLHLVGRISICKSIAYRVPQNHVIPSSVHFNNLSHYLFKKCSISLMSAFSWITELQPMSTENESVTFQFSSSYGFINPWRIDWPPCNHFSSVAPPSGGNRLSNITDQWKMLVWPHSQLWDVVPRMTAIFIWSVESPVNEAGSLWFKCHSNGLRSMPILSLHEFHRFNYMTATHSSYRCSVS